MWNGLSVAQKEPYMRMHQKDILRATEEKKSYEELVGVEQWKKLKMAEKERQLAVSKRKEAKRVQELCEANKRPKRPLSPYLLFVNDTGRKLQDMKENGLAWTALPQSQKDKFSAQYQKLSTEFNLELRKWEMRMVEEGNYDLVRPKYRPEDPKMAETKRLQAEKLRKKKLVTAKKAAVAQRKRARMLQRKLKMRQLAMKQRAKLAAAQTKKKALQAKEMAKAKKLKEAFTMSLKKFTDAEKKAKAKKLTASKTKKASA